MASQRDGVKSITINGVKQYAIAGLDYTASWLSGKKLRALRKKKGQSQETVVLQNLRFETATTKIKATHDGEYVIASGIYPPQVKVYEVRQLSMKFERHLISEVINFQVLGDDYSKIAFLCADRSVCLHAKYGSHYSLRIPRMGRDIAYDCWSCDLLCAASSPDLYRINLEQGRFMSSLNTQSPAINVVSRSMVHGLVACGGEDGAVECFDIRAKSSVGRISAIAPTGVSDQEVTALQFDEDAGFRMAVGSSTGKVLIYDLRSSYPIRVKDHMYGSPIVNIKWHRTLNCMEPKLISADNHIVRIWDPETGNNVTSIEPTGGNINDVCTFPESGLMLLALDCSQIPSHFIPALGPAPKWCRLEQFSEDMEEPSNVVIYDDMKYVTKDDLERLNLTKLPSKFLRPTLHGFLIDYRLYQEALSLAEPFSYEAYKEKKKQEKLEAERASRITIKRKLPKVNRVLAARILEDQEVEEDEMEDDRSKKKKSLKKRKELSSKLLQDERFTAMFENKDFEIDESSEDYRSRHSQPSMEKRSLIEEHFEPIVEDDQEEASSDSDVSEDVFNKDKSIPKKKNAKIPRLYEVKDERHAEAFWNNMSLDKEEALPLGERFAILQEQRNAGISSDVKLGPGGSREITFVSRSSVKHKAERRESREGKRRGIQSLGLRPDRSHFRGRGGRGRSRGRGRH